MGKKHGFIRGTDKNSNMFWQPAQKNSQAFMQYYNRLVELSATMFEWKGLPDTVDERYLELALFTDGKAVFFKDDVMGYLALRCTMGGRLDVYNIPTKRRAYAANGYNVDLSEQSNVVIFNNYLHTPARLDIYEFARKLADLDRTIEVNARAQKTPVLLTCTEQQRLSVENMYEQFDGNRPVIFATKGMEAPDVIKVLKTDAPYVGDRLYELKIKYWNEALTYLGIPNIAIEKKERLISDEVQRSAGGTIASRFSRLEMRKQACKEINKMFPELNVSVDYRLDVLPKSEANDAPTENIKGGE